MPRPMIRTMNVFSHASGSTTNANVFMVSFLSLGAVWKESGITASFHSGVARAIPRETDDLLDPYADLECDYKHMMDESGTQFIA